MAAAAAKMVEELGEGDGEAASLAMEPDKAAVVAMRVGINAANKVDIGEDIKVVEGEEEEDPLGVAVVVVAAVAVVLSQSSGITSL